MNFTSTMKSPDQIKRALWHCMGDSQCDMCPYAGGKCVEHMCADALEYIRELEAKPIEPLRPSLRQRLWRLFHPLKWRKMKKLRLDEMHEYKLIHREPTPNVAIITEEVRE